MLKELLGSWLVFLCALALTLAAGCGGSGAEATSTGGGTGGTTGGDGFAMSYSQREAAMTTVSDFFATLPHADPGADTQAMADYLATRPEFESVFHDVDRRAILAKLKGGPVVAILNNQPYEGYSRSRQAWQAPAASLPPATRGIPESSNCLLFNSFHPLYDAAYRIATDASFAGMEPALTAAGYQVQKLDASVENLRTKVSPTDSNGIGFVCVMGHGTPFKRFIEPNGGDPIIVTGDMYALRTSTGINLLDDLQYAQEMHDGLIGPMLCPDLSDTGRWTMGKTYYVTDQFIRKHWQLNKNNSFVFMNSCESQSELAPPMREAMGAVGCTQYVGWTGLVHPIVAFPASSYLVSTMLGSSNGVIGGPGNLRPFDLKKVIDEMITSRRGVSYDPQKKRDISIAATALGPGPNFTQFVPSIQYLYIDERRQTLSIYGEFGQNDNGTGRVTLDGADLPILSWGTSLIKATIPDFKTGKVAVSVRNHPSNEVPITRWSAGVDVLQEYFTEGTKQVKVHFDVSYRGDAHGYRVLPGGLVNLDGVLNLTLAEKVSRATYEASGSFFDPDSQVTTTLSGSGSVDFAFDTPSLGEPNANGFSSTLAIILDNPLTLKAQLSAVKAGCINEQFSSKDGVFNSPVDLSVSTKIQLPVAAGTYLGTAGQSVVTEGKTRTTTTWTAFTPTNPPKPDTKRGR